MPEVHHGIKITSVASGARSLGVASTAVLGIVATATGVAAEAMFPLDTPVAVTDIMAAISAAGNTGTLGKVLDAIADQVNCTVVVVRVAIDADQVDQDGLVVGTSANGLYTGMKAFLSAASRGVPKPNIIAAPGLDTATVTAELAVVAKKLNGLAYARALGATVADAVDYAGDFAQRELMLFWPDFNDFTGSAVARALGLRAQIDKEIGWHKTISNMPIGGVTGLSKDVVFDITGDGGDNKLLNDAKIVAVVNNQGFRFWGNRTLSSEAAYAFESAVRTDQVLRDAIGVGLVEFIDLPITKFLVTDIIDTLNNLGGRLKQQGRIMGFKAKYPPEKNSQADLAGGKLAIDYEFTPCAPLESLGLTQTLTDTYYADLMS